MYRNLTDALVGSLRKLLKDGYTVSSRNGETKELYSHQVRIERPTERVLMTPFRGANIFAQLAESMWVVAGRDDMEFLSRYLPRAKDYSDDGEVWRGAYGPRLRAWPLGDNPPAHSTTNPDPENFVDPLEECVKILCEALDSRRAAMVIFDPARDYCDSKDIPCLAGDTLLWSPEGDLPISEVAEKFSSGEVDRWPVYAVDPETQALSLQWATKVWKSGGRATIKLNFDDGSSLRVTPDHRLYWKGHVKREGEHPKATFTEIRECEAGDLKPGDRVWATQRFYNPKGYEQHKKFLNRNTAWENLQPTAREYMELLNGPIPDGHDVHHVNEIKTDNWAENLETHEHGYHSSFNMQGDDNPMCRLSPKGHENRAQKQAASLKKNHSGWSIEKRAAVSEKQRRAALKRSRNDDGTWASDGPGNHKIVSIEDGGVAPVYDFRVPEGHTALVGTGVVAHNCNNWLHWLVRDGKLNLTVGIRSNDAIWGFSGINVFEWSILMQMMAHWLDIEVGTMAYTASSFHLYDYHYEKAEKIVARAKGKTLYDWGFPTPKFSTCWEDFDESMEEFFRIERRISEEKVIGDDILGVPDDFLRVTLQLLQVYQWYKKDASVEGVVGLLGEIPDHDLKVGAIDWLMRQKRMREEGFIDSLLPHLSEKMREYFEWYRTPPKPLEIKGVFDVLKTLHYKKTLSYGASWKKHGEVLGLFSNITRKRDRILALADGATGTADEGIIDTLADLTVYAAKYLTLIAEMYPNAFRDYLRSPDMQVVYPCEVDPYVPGDFKQTVSGFNETLDMLLVRPEVTVLQGTETLKECLDAMEREYKNMEDILLDQGARTERGERVVMYATWMAVACAQAVCILSQATPGLWAQYTTTVENL